MNMAKEAVLMGLGLSLNESRIYVSLLEKGIATTTEIAAASGVHRVNVYDSVSKLKEKGLVGEVSQKGKKCYQAAPPQSLRNIIKEKEMQLDKVLPQLEIVRALNPQSNCVQLFEGYGCVRNMFLHFLSLKKDIYSMGIPKFVLEQMGKNEMDGKYFQDVIHKRRAEQKQMMYHIYNQDAVERIKFLNTLPYTEARYLENDSGNAVVTTICGDEVFIKVFSKDGKTKPQIIAIKNQLIADAYKEQFLVLWEVAKLP